MVTATTPAVRRRECVLHGERESSWISDGGGRIGGWRDRMQQRRERQMGWWGESEMERDSLGAESLERKMIGSQEMGGIQSVCVCVCGEKEWTQAWVRKWVNSPYTALEQSPHTHAHTRFSLCGQALWRVAGLMPGGALRERGKSEGTDTQSWRKHGRGQASGNSFTPFVAFMLFFFSDWLCLKAFFITEILCAGSCFCWSLDWDW